MKKPALEQQNRNISGPAAVALISLGLAIVGTAGFFTFHGSLAGYLLAHLAALGVTGILAWLTGLIARKKGYRFWRIFLVALTLPLFLGFVAVISVFYIAHVGDSIACAGSVSLSISLLFIIGYAVARSKRIAGA